jgi:hypothetical protein
VRRSQIASWDRFVTSLEHETNTTKPKLYKIVTQISNDIKETAKNQGNIEENILLQYYEKLRNTANKNTRI